MLKLTLRMRSMREQGSPMLRGLLRYLFVLPTISATFWKIRKIADIDESDSAVNRGARALIHCECYKLDVLNRVF